MRILQVINSADPAGGGPIEAIRQAHFALSERGHQTEIVCLDDPNSEWLAGLGVPTHALGPARSSYRYCYRLIPWLLSHGAEYDCAILNGIWLYPSFATWKVFRQLGLPYYVYIHGLLDPAHKRLFPWKHWKKWFVWKVVERRILNDATKIFFTCEEERSLAGQLFSSLPSHNTTILPYCIGSPPDNEKEQHAAFRQAFPELADRRVILFLSRIHPKKGCDLTLDAFAVAIRSDPSLHLVIAGNGPPHYRRKLESQVRRLGIERNVTWTGMLRGNVKWGAFRSAEVFILPSHQENCGIAIVEALACRLPVLISNQVNIWREVTTFEAGLVCEDTSSSVTQSLLQWLSLSAAQRDRMRDRAIQCFRERFAINVSADLLLGQLKAGFPNCEIHTGSSVPKRQQGHFIS